VTVLEPSVLILVLALSFDLLVGDPRWLLHPTQIMGAGIGWLEKCWWQPASPCYLIVTGSLLVVIIVAASWLVTWGLLQLVAEIYWAKITLAAWLLATTITPRGLAGAGLNVSRALAAGDLAGARRMASRIVGRDTDKLNESEVVRATVETVAENTGDGIIAPLFYFFLGGVPLAMAYRAVNTLDSMLGYKNDRYLFFGRAAAKLDDIANYLPGRLTGITLCAAAILLGYGWRGWFIMVRDARKHPSPNSGYAEAAVAGALRVQLGGLNYYQGVPSQRPRMGEALENFSRKHIIRAVSIMVMATIVFSLIGGLFLGLKGCWY